jgi:hypothetical protein
MNIINKSLRSLLQSNLKGPKGFQKCVGGLDETILGLSKPFCFDLGLKTFLNFDGGLQISRSVPAVGGLIGTPTRIALFGVYKIQLIL